LYESEICGPKSDRDGVETNGTVIDPVPVTEFTENFSPMARIAPPPLGSEIGGVDSSRDQRMVSVPGPPRVFALLDRQIGSAPLTHRMCGCRPTVSGSLARQGTSILPPA
jgi:hypothetical protein